MPEEITLVSTKIKDKGIFNMEDLYAFIKDWLVLHNMGDEGSMFKEQTYVERVKGDSRQIEIKWKAERFNGDYFSNVIEITFLIVGLKDIEIEVEGRKIPTQKLELELRIVSKLIKNRQDKFKSDFIRNIYENTIIKDRIDFYAGEFYGESSALVNDVKKFLELRRG